MIVLKTEIYCSDEECYDEECINLFLETLQKLEICLAWDLKFPGKFNFLKHKTFF